MKRFLTGSAISLTVILAACQKVEVQNATPAPHDAALQDGLDELTRLQSYTQVGVNYQQYSDRVLTAKGNIDVDLQRSSDEPAKDQIERAVSFYITALDMWKVRIDSNNTFVEDFTQQEWSRGSSAIAEASKFAFSNAAIRQQILGEEAAEEKALMAQEEADRQAQEQERKREELATAEAAKEERAREDEQAKESQMEEEAKEKAAAEQERIRRYAPDGTVFNIGILSVTGSDSVASIRPGSELRVLKKNPDGTLHVQYNDMETDVQPSQVTNDRDLAANVRADDADKQAALRQWQQDQANAAAQMEADKAANSYHPQATATPDDIYVSPLDQGHHP